MNLVGQRNYYKKRSRTFGYRQRRKNDCWVQRNIDQRESSSTARFSTIFEDRDGQPTNGITRNWHCCALVGLVNNMRKSRQMMLL